MRFSHSNRFHTAALALALSAMLAVPAARAEEPRIATIDMTGRGTVTAAPDLAWVSSGVVSDAKTAAEALTANNAAMTAVIERIKSAGIEGRDIQTNGFSVMPRYKRVDPKSNQQDYNTVIGYRVSNGVRVRVRQLDGLGKLLDAMVRDGANRIDGIAFEVSNAEELKDEARKAAMADAMRKAKLYAEAAGVSLDRVLSINEQDFGPRPKMMMARAEMAMPAAGAAPIEAGEETLEVRVNVTWQLSQ